VEPAGASRNALPKGTAGAGLDTSEVRVSRVCQGLQPQKLPYVPLHTSL
jgi:hypothetical protein